jgi:uncharacterized membrane protein (UPF0127 family)
MMPARWLAALVLRRGAAKPHVQLSLLNHSRQTELAGCVDLADDTATRRRGLLGRQILGHNEGLWIVPCEAVHTVGMRFCIDIIYLDRAKRVKKVCHSVPPNRLSACLSAYSVVELAAGSIRRSGTIKGDQLEFFSPASHRKL